MVLAIPYIFSCGKFRYLLSLNAFIYERFSQVIVGTVVTRSPNSTVSGSALLDLDVAVDLFEKTAKQSYRAGIALVCASVYPLRSV